MSEDPRRLQALAAAFATVFDESAGHSAEMTARWFAAMHDADHAHEKVETEQARREVDECICAAPHAHSASLEPPEVRRNRACPIHGDLRHTDPDRARDEEMDR